MSSSGKIEPRKQGGFSLVTVLVLGMISTLWVSALFTAVLPGYQRVSHSRQQHVLRASAEASVDWTVAQLNATPNPAIDDTTDNGQPNSPVLVPAGAIGSYGMPVSVSVEINNIPPPQSSYMWDPLLDPTNPQGAGLNGQQYWRIVTATATMGGNNASKTVRVILRPTPTSNQGSGPLDGAMFARDTFSSNGLGAVVDAYDSSDGAYGGANSHKLGGGIGSNKSVSLAGNQEIYGNVSVSSGTGTESDNNVVGMNNVTVRGGVLSNGLADAHYDSHTLGEGLALGTPPVQEGLQLQQKQFPAVPNPPATANTISAINLMGNSTLTLPAGDYIVPKIYINGPNAQLITSGQVRIWVQGTNVQFQIQGKGVSNTTGVPANLQLYYAGTNNVILGGNGDFKGVLYAPNAPVGLSVTAPGNVYGSVVAHRITQTGTGQFHYDLALTRSNIFTTQASMVPRWRAVSWQEI